jgi:pyridoxamine 5'-phosphate oxidase
MAAPRLSSPAVNIAALRREYQRAALTETEVDPDPMRQFDRWLKEAIAAGLPESSAMTLATVDDEARPDARIVLLKGTDADGFVFFTNYASRKGGELARHPVATLLFHWVELERQVRIEGTVTQVATEQLDAYFAARPHEARLGAWASAESCDPRPRLARAGGRRRQGTIRAAGRGAAPAAGRLPGRCARDRILAGQGLEAARPARYRREGSVWRIERLAP